MLDGLAELLFPTRCAGCDMPGGVVCRGCADALPRIAADTACPRCGAPYGFLVCTECWEREWSFEAALAVGEFEMPLARMVALHKDAGERRLAPVLGGLVAEQVASQWPGWAQGVAFVPATRQALARRGFDHGQAIARAVAEQLSLPLVEPLARSAAGDQRELGRQARATNVAGTFNAVGTLRGRVVLCDDVFTTGATLDAAASVLLVAGAEAVRCAAVARVW